MLALLSAGSALGAAAPPSLSTHAAPAGPTTIGRASCMTGNSPCVNATGTIGANSCNGDYACYGAFGNIGDNSCIGTSACEGAGAIGNNACHGTFSCIHVDGVLNCAE